MDFSKCKDCIQNGKCNLEKYVTNIVNFFFFESSNTKYYKEVYRLDFENINLDNLISNCIMGVIDILFARKKEYILIKEKQRLFELEGIPITRDILNKRQDRIDNSKKNIIPKKDYSENEMYFNELLLILHEIINGIDEEYCEEESTDISKNKQHHHKRQNPILKLSNYQNITSHNYSKSDLKELIEYMSKVYKYINSNKDIDNLDRVTMLYHIETNLRFETFFEILKRLKKSKFDKEKHDMIINEARGFVMFYRAYTIYGLQDSYIQNTYTQNRIYFGYNDYIKKIFDNPTMDNAINTIEEMLGITEIINDVVDSIEITDDKIPIEKCQLANILYDSALNQLNKKKNVDDVKLIDFINIYMPDNKFKEKNNI